MVLAPEHQEGDVNGPPAEVSRKKGTVMRKNAIFIVWVIAVLALMCGVGCLVAYKYDGAEQLAEAGRIVLVALTCAGGLFSFASIISKQEGATVWCGVAGTFVSALCTIIMGAFLKTV